MRIVLHDSLSMIRARLEKEMSRFSMAAFLNECDGQDDIHIWVWDGAGAKKTRQLIFPQYKAQRQPMAESISDGLRLIKELMRLTDAISVEVPGFEADDVIARLVAKHAPALPVHIETRDLDLRALVPLGPKVSCRVDPKILKVEEDRVVPIADADLRLFKTFVGDPSDNVPGVKGFGAKAWAKLAAAERVYLRNTIDLLERGIRPKEEELLEVMSASSAKWVVQNSETLIAMWTVTGFLPVSDEEIEKGTVVGKSQPQVRDEILGELML